MDRPKPPVTLSTTVSLRTRWSDEDNHGVLNNAIFLTLMEEARLAYFSRLELMRGGRFPFVLAQTNVAFLRPGRGGVEVSVELGTVALGRSSLTQVYRVREASSGVVWAEAEALLVCVDEGGASRAMEEGFRARIRELEDL